MGYYYGDLYRGDPGFLSGISRAFSQVRRVAQPAIEALGSVLHHPTAAASAATGAVARTGGAVIRRAGTEIAGHPVLAAAGAAAAGAGLMREAAARGAAPMRGMHISRKSGRLVRNRHMRVTNTKALRRALRRVGGFSRIASRVMRITHPQKRGRYHFRMPKRRKRAAA